MPDGTENGRTGWIGWLAGLSIAVVSAIAGQVYEDVKAYFLPDKISGEYVTLSADEPGKPPEQSRLTLASHDGVIKGTGARGDKRWLYSGYLKNGYVVLSYRSTEETGLGFGTVFLADPKGDNREYVGYYEGNVCPERRVYRCNTVLIKGTADGPDAQAAVARYSALLNQKCMPIDNFTEATAPNSCAK